MGLGEAVHLVVDTEVNARYVTVSGMDNINTNITVLSSSNTKRTTD